MRKKKAACPNCRGRLEFEPDQDGACDWYCPKCGWSQHEPPASSRERIDPYTGKRCRLRKG
jgi:predicted RNA-binding Zn-ribbon protein involved in translation (DUF1610 family)